MADSLKVALLICFHYKVRVTITLPGLDSAGLNKSLSMNAFPVFQEPWVKNSLLTQSQSKLEDPLLFSPNGYTLSKCLIFFLIGKDSNCLHIFKMYINKYLQMSEIKISSLYLNLHAWPLNAEMCHFTGIYKQFALKIIQEITLQEISKVDSNKSSMLFYHFQFFFSS